MKIILSFLSLIYVLGVIVACDDDTTTPDTTSNSDPLEVSGTIPTQIGFDMPDSMSMDAASDRLSSEDTDITLSNYTYNDYDVYRDGYTITKHCMIVGNLAIHLLEAILEGVKEVESEILNLNGELYPLGTKYGVMLSKDTSSNEYTLIYGLMNTAGDAIETKLAYVTWSLKDGKAKGKGLFTNEDQGLLFQQAGVVFDHQSSTPSLELFLTEGPDIATGLDKLHIKIQKTDATKDSDFEIWVYPNSGDQFFLKAIEESTTIPYKEGEDRSTLPTPYVKAYGYIMADGQGAMSCEFGDFGFYNDSVSVDLPDDNVGDLILLQSQGIFYFDALGNDMGHYENITEVDASYSSTEAPNPGPMQLGLINTALDLLVTNPPDYKRYADNRDDFTQPDLLVTKMSEVIYLSSTEPTDTGFFDNLAN